MCCHAGVCLSDATVQGLPKMHAFGPLPCGTNGKYSQSSQSPNRSVANPAPDLTA